MQPPVLSRHLSVDRSNWGDSPVDFLLGSDQWPLSPGSGVCSLEATVVHLCLRSLSEHSTSLDLWRVSDWLIRAAGPHPKSINKSQVKGTF